MGRLTFMKDDRESWAWTTSHRVVDRGRDSPADGSLRGWGRIQGSKMEQMVEDYGQEKPKEGNCLSDNLRNVTIRAHL